MTETTIETNNSLLTKNNVLQRSNAARLEGGCELLEANHAVLGVNSATASDNRTVVAGISRTLTVHGLLLAFTTVLGVAA